MKETGGTEYENGETKTSSRQREREREKESEPEKERERRTDDDGWAVCAIYLSAVAFIIPVS